MLGAASAPPAPHTPGCCVTAYGEAEGWVRPVLSVFGAHADNDIRVGTSIGESAGQNSVDVSHTQGTGSPAGVGASNANASAHLQEPADQLQPL